MYAALPSLLEREAREFQGQAALASLAGTRLAEPALAKPAPEWWLAGRDGRPPEARSMIPLKPRQIFIQGITRDGKTFRPSDWAERLAGAMSCFRPGGGTGGISAAIGYSPYCFPNVIDGVKCVIVSEELKALEPMAWDFVINFARDNGLVVVDACLLPEPPKA
jgi:Protein of unknown function (DUF3579)